MSSACYGINDCAHHITLYFHVYSPCIMKNASFDPNPAFLAPLLPDILLSHPLPQYGLLFSAFYLWFLRIHMQMRFCLLVTVVCHLALCSMIYDYGLCFTVRAGVGIVVEQIKLPLGKPDPWLLYLQSSFVLTYPNKLWMRAEVIVIHDKARGSFGLLFSI